jgi:glycosyltransferase involved in cell wall biosynthesis
MKLSICIPTYNRDARLLVCLQSLEAASFLLETPIEILVSNNASTDDTYEILKRWHFTNPYVTFNVNTNTANLGAYENIKALIKMAKGEYLFWCTDDDLLLPAGIDEILTILKKHSPDYAKFAIISYLEQSKISYYYGGRSDLISDGSDLERFVEIYRYSHVLTGTLARRSICQFTLDEDTPNIYPSAVWAVLGAKNAHYNSTPIAIHTWENPLYWELDVDLSSEYSKQSQLNRDFQLALKNSPITFSAARNRKHLPKWLFEEYGEIERALKLDFSYFSFFDRQTAKISRLTKKVVQKLKRLL